MIKCDNVTNKETGEPALIPEGEYSGHWKGSTVELRVGGVDLTCQSALANSEPEDEQPSICTVKVSSNNVVLVRKSGEAAPLNLT